jgi:hypothetical protein
LTAISRYLAPFDKHSWMDIVLNGLFWSSAPVHLWAPERSSILDPTSQKKKKHPGDVACPSKKSTTVISIEGLNCGALEVAGRGYTVANCVSDDNAAHGSSASVMEVTKAVEPIFP